MRRLVFSLVLVSAWAFAAPIPNLQISRPGAFLKIEILDDNLLHLEWSAVKTAGTTLWTSPMVEKKNYPGPKSWRYANGVLETTTLRLVLDSLTGLVTLSDRRDGRKLAAFLPKDLGLESKTLEIQTQATHAYGLGEYPRLGGTDQDWVGHKVQGGPDGNIMQGFVKGANAFTQFPMLYGLGSRGETFGLFLDQPFKVEWDLTDRQLWKAQMNGDAIRAYVMGGEDIPVLRKRLMELTGRPPVPPRELFGFGISQFGYENWEEIFKDVGEMHGTGIPVKLVALDLQWFGGTFVDPKVKPEGNVNSLMGGLNWDNVHFPNPREKITALKAMGVEVMPISESYVHGTLPEYHWGKKFNIFAVDAKGEPAWARKNPWWGIGPMIDWTNPSTLKWVEEKYVPQADLGISNFWLDLGEPEIQPEGDVHYFGYPELNRHAGVDIYNLYNLFWAKRVVDGLGAHFPKRRFFTFSRSGTIGLQRYGGKWGGDTGSGFQELLAHLQNRIMTMPFVGLDYHASDIGGFHRWSIAGDRPKLDRLYTQWMANSLLLDFPARPHLWNLDRSHPFLPTKVGDVKSNLANIRLRYELMPYYYTAAHRAFEQGDPLISPLVYRYQRDPEVRRLGSEALIGDDLLMGVVVNEKGETERDVYLPVGDWYEYHTNRAFPGTAGRWVKGVSTYPNGGTFRLPLFVRAGAILPLGNAHGDTAVELRLRVYPNGGRSSSTVIEDDGWSTDYQKKGGTRRTLVFQEARPYGLGVTVGGAKGGYRGETRSRSVRLEVVVGSRSVGEVYANGRRLKQLTARPATGERGYFEDQGVVTVSLGNSPSASAQRVEVQYQD